MHYCFRYSLLDIICFSCFILTLLNSGTDERVIRIGGDLDNILEVISFIQDKQDEVYGDKIPSERAKQVILHFSLLLLDNILYLHTHFKNIYVNG